jgi:SAM-dependent methyltransferase
LKWQSAVVAQRTQVEERIVAAAQRTDEQAKLWNGSAGCAWVEAQALLDRVLQPFQDVLVAAVSATGARRVLDVGCGTGSTTRAVARLLGTNSDCVGVDISEQMIDTARMLAEQERAPAKFICADAQTHSFEPASFDMIMSRFGVMFFADPVRAFANLRNAASEEATLCFVAWRSPVENQFMTTAERAAAALLPNLPARRADAPGQFGFADARRVQSILAESGWKDIDIQPIDMACTLPENELSRYGARLGPVGVALREVDPRTREQVVAVVRKAFEPYVHGDEVRFTACCWKVDARR